jgi:hypothetical protein
MELQTTEIENEQHCNNVQRPNILKVDPDGYEPSILSGRGCLPEWRYI